MKIIIVGAGKAGTLLIESLSEEGYDITLIEKSPEIVKEITDKYNVIGIVGSGASQETLEKAGANTADMLIALTAVDEVNLLSCLQAKNLGTRRTAARLLMQDLADEQNELKKQYSIDHIICPKIDIARLIAQNSGLPGNVKLEGFFGDEIQMLSIYIDKASSLKDRTLKEIKQDIQSNVLVVGTVREGKLIIPNGEFKILEGDDIYLLADKEGMLKAFEEFDIIRNNGKKVLIVGGGITCEYLSDMLIAAKKNIRILESNITSCQKLMERFPSADISYGNGESIDVLEEEHVEKMDVVISLTDKDETNLVVSLFAWAKGVPSIITRVDSPGHAKLLHRVNMDITVSPSEMTTNKIMRFVRNQEVGDAKNEIRRFYSICDGLADIMEFIVTSSAKNLNIEFKEATFKLKKDTLIAAIIRNSQVIIPNGRAKLLAGDNVIVVSAKKNHILTLNDIFA